MLEHNWCYLINYLCFASLLLKQHNLIIYLDLLLFNAFHIVIALCNERLKTYSLAYYRLIANCNQLYKCYVATILQESKTHVQINNSV